MVRPTAITGAVSRSRLWLVVALLAVTVLGGWYFGHRAAGDDRELPADAERLLALWAQWRALGFTPDRGFTPADLAIFADVADRLVAVETKLLLERLGHLGPAEAAPMLERALPLVHATLIHFHQAAVATFFATADVTPRRPDAAR